jgi:hypothetical protein
MAPVLPWLTDGEAELEQAVARIAAAGATGLSVIPLHLRPGAREWFLEWLARERPALVGRYRGLYRRGAYVPAQYRDWLNARVRPLLERYGLAPSPVRPAEDGSAGVPGDPDADYPEGSLPRRFTSGSGRPTGGLKKPAPPVEQPRLL